MYNDKSYSYDLSNKQNRLFRSNARYERFYVQKTERSYNKYDFESRKEWLIDLFYDRNIEQFNIWQPEFRPIELDDNKIIDQKLEYIHNNPVQAGFVEKEEDWNYSSAKDYYTDFSGLLNIDIYNIRIVAQTKDICAIGYLIISYMI